MTIVCRYYFAPGNEDSWALSIWFGFVLSTFLRFKKTLKIESNFLQTNLYKTSQSAPANMSSRYGSRYLILNNE